MKKSSLLCFFAVICTFANAQISQGGEPFNWSDKSLPANLTFIRTSSPDLQQLALQDAITDQYKDVPYRFGVEHDVTIDILAEGVQFKNEKRTIIQYGIECPGALNVSLTFSKFTLPAGSMMYIWSADRKEYIGGFNSEHREAGTSFATSLIHGDKVIIEIDLGSHAIEASSVILGQIVHGYRPFLKSHFEEETAERGPFGNADPCEVNVNCPAAADWQVEKKAVAVIVQGGYGICSGSLVNNTANDGTPYFLTANHCISGSNVGNWVFYFNHEAATCSGSTGPTNQSISGSTVKANNANSDFALLLLNQTPSTSWNVQYAGWDATDLESNVTSAVCIHHPAGDVKKFSREDDAPYHDVGNGAQVWWVDDWELGVTEGGSSGSPLFNQSHRIIGQLYGGASGCNGSVGNGQYDFYGRFGVSWNGTAANKRLKDWLDPGNTGLLVLDGYPTGAQLAALDAGATTISGIPTVSCGSQVTPQVTLKNFGATTLTSCTLNYQINGGTQQAYVWSGSLASNAQTVVTLPTISASNGNNTLTVTVSNPNNGSDQNASNNTAQATFTAFTGQVFEATVSIELDNYPEETSWRITSAGNTLYSGGTYGSMADGATVTIPVCLPAGCYTFTILDTEGDGICCGYGFGSYEVTNQFGDVMASGGNFGASQSTQICLSANSVEDFSGSIVSVFPSPAKEEFTVKSSSPIESIEVLDINGKLIHSIRPNAIIENISTSGWADGLYLIRVRDQSGMTNSKVIIQH